MTKVDGRVGPKKWTEERWNSIEQWRRDNGEDGEPAKVSEAMKHFKIHPSNYYQMRKSFGKANPRPTFAKRAYVKKRKFTEAPIQSMTFEVAEPAQVPAQIAVAIMSLKTFNEFIRSQQWQ